MRLRTSAIRQIRTLADERPCRSRAQIAQFDAAPDGRCADQAADRADQERTKPSAELHSVIGPGVSGQFLMAVDEQIAISETANPQVKPVAERP
jgi:hypothetical protein